MSKPLIEVAAGLILRADGWLLLAERPAGKPWSGWWELPGGKIEAGETVLQALARELKEELDIDVTNATPWVTYTHEYPKNMVRLSFCRVTGWKGEPAGIEGQRLAWVDPHKPITVGTLLPATEPPLRWLRLPDQYLITSIERTSNLAGFLEQLDHALQNGVKLVQFREPFWSDDASTDEVNEGFRQVLQRCHQGGAQCLLNSVHPQRWRDLADGVHWRACDARAQATPASPTQGLVGVSAHTSEDLAAARRLNADFVVLGHVLATPSHPGQPGMGWARFSQLAEQAGRPVFAIGGQSRQTLGEAQHHGAHGVAGMRYLLAG
ncbi:MAG: Nudix family hydrolase [Paralcaligenes sp.]